MMEQSNMERKFNWALQIKRIFFNPFGRGDLKDDLSLASKQELIKEYKDHLLRVDKLKKEKTTSLLLSSGIRLSPGCQNFLKIRLQIRLH